MRETASQWRNLNVNWRPLLASIRLEGTDVTKNDDCLCVRRGSGSECERRGSGGSRCTASAACGTENRVTRAGICLDLRISPLGWECVRLGAGNLGDAAAPARALGPSPMGPPSSRVGLRGRPLALIRSMEAVLPITRRQPARSSSIDRLPLFSLPKRPPYSIGSLSPCHWLQPGTAHRW